MDSDGLSVSKKDHKRIEHGGEWQGFTCDIARYPDDKLTVVILANLAGANPGVIAQVTAGLVDSALLPPKLVPITDTQPRIAASLARLLDQLMAGEDIRPQTTTQLAARMTPEANKWVRHRLSPLWPGGALTLVKVIPPPSPSDQSRFVFRLSKGDDAVLIFFGVDSNRKISTLRTAPDREYDR